MITKNEKIITLSDITNGMICDGAVAISQFPSNAVSLSINFDFDTIGCAKLRSGTTLLGSQVEDNRNVLGLHQFIDYNGDNKKIMSVVKDTLYYLSGGTWTAKRTGLTEDKKARFTDFLNYTFMVNGSNPTAIWDGVAGNAFSTSGNATNAPIGKFIENYTSRIWIAGNPTYPDRVYYSSRPSATTTPVITWNTSVTDGDWTDVSPQDGENITALKRSKSALLVFKQNHIYRIYSPSSSDPDPKINVGTYSQESVVETKSGIFFHHPTGIYLYQEGAYPQEVSKPIVDFINSIPSSQYENVCGWCDGDGVYYSFGDLTVNGITYVNVVAKYLISTKVWSLRSYPTKILCASDYDDGTTLWRLVGDNDGNVLKVNYGNTDNGTPIYYDLQSRWETIDGNLSTRKNISKMAVLTEGLKNGTLTFKVDNEPNNVWHKAISILKEIPSPETVDIKGNKIKFRLQGTSVGEPFTYNGINIITMSAETIG